MGDEFISIKISKYQFFQSLGSFCHLVKLVVWGLGLYRNLCNLYIFLLVSIRNFVVFVLKLIRKLPGDETCNKPWALLASSIFNIFYCFPTILCTYLIVLRRYFIVLCQPKKNLHKPIRIKRRSPTMQRSIWNFK